ncbi:intraflagellar transport protein 140 homolog isoform X3 [Bolinopsis microptera]|uniref:intraflagellar transport protein 140 homolog isoform X3 n=1 Tax=Bolinopsis microptera TaxID=2820187 RepID=UPI00307A0CDA
MSVFFDHRAGTNTNSVHTDIQWHPTFALLAVATKIDDADNEAQGAVSLFFDEGEPVEEINIEKNCAPTTMSWHPTRKILSVGWENGDITLWNEHEHEGSCASDGHKAPVNILSWSSNGTRLISGDERGVMIAWRCDSKGQLHQLQNYQKRSSYTHCTFRPVPGGQDPFYNNYTALARAAVEGDETALDMFGTWNKSGMGNSLLSQPGQMYAAESLSCYIGSEDGVIFHIDEKLVLRECSNVETMIKAMLIYEAKNILVVVTTTMMLIQFSCAADGSLTELMKVKLSGKSSITCVVWTGPGLMATVAGEDVVRLWDLDKDNNFSLGGALDQINCLSYSASKRILAGGLVNGKIAMWQHRPGTFAQEHWIVLPTIDLSDSFIQIQWSPAHSLLAANNISDVVILNEQPISTSISVQSAVVQISPYHVQLETLDPPNILSIRTDVHIRGVCNSEDHVVLWNSKKIVVYEINEEKNFARLAGTFDIDSPLTAIYQQTIFTAETTTITARNFQGTIKQTMNLAEQEGIPISIDICGHYLVVATDNGFVKGWDISRRESRQYISPKNISESLPDTSLVTDVKVNCNGTKIAIQLKKVNEEPDSRLLIWYVEQDILLGYDFSAGQTIQPISDNGSAGVEAAAVEQSNSEDVSRRYPKEVLWDPLDPRLLVVQASPLSVEINEKTHIKKPTPSGVFRTKSSAEKTPELDDRIVSLFATSDNGVLLHDSFPMEPGFYKLLGVSVPSFYFILQPEDIQKADGTVSTVSNGETTGETRTEGLKERVSAVTMRNFVGLEKSNLEVRQAMLDFAYHLTIGNLDEAFKAIKLIKSETVWENMAKMCVKTRRLDVAALCLGHMGHARGAQALRDCAHETELNARVAMLAIQLGMLEEAEQLYTSCGRYDLLNKLYQANNQWSKAIAVAERHDRIHLRSTYYNFARHCELSGDIGAAINGYEKSETHRFEVPRMLFENVQELEAYVIKSKDKKLLGWWAQYLESNGEMDSALQFYQAAEDIMSFVRIWCYCGRFDEAISIASNTNDRAACYHLARQLENQERFAEAVQFYGKAQAYTNATRICRANQLDSELISYAMYSTEDDMTICAHYYEETGSNWDKAIMLYHKAGQVGKALELAFEHQQFTALQHITSNLDDSVEPETLHTCAQFFLEHQQYSKAVDLLLLAKKYLEALDICIDKHISITEDLAEQISPDKDAEPEYKKVLFERIGECCMLQGAYHLATKKFTQAGNRVKAMRALLKSGDTEKIIFFAGVSRQKEIYVMAANYLQRLDWRKDPEIMKNIITFYTKGKALESLSGFYDACAQVEIDEYQNYEKALGALSEALKCMNKAKMQDVSTQEAKINFLKRRISLLKKFVQARRSYEEDTEEAMRQCMVLLEETDLDTGVRSGDIYGFMIEHYASTADFQKAYHLVQELKQRLPNASLAYYVNNTVLEQIKRNVGLDEPALDGAADTSGIDEEIEEDIPEDFGF